MADLLYRHGLSEDFEAHSHHVLMQLLTLSFMERRAPQFTGR